MILVEADVRFQAGLKTLVRFPRGLGNHLFSLLFILTNKRSFHNWRATKSTASFCGKLCPSLSEADRALPLSELDITQCSVQNSLFYSLSLHCSSTGKSNTKIEIHTKKTAILEVFHLIRITQAAEASYQLQIHLGLYLTQNPVSVVWLQKQKNM